MLRKAMLLGSAAIASIAFIVPAGASAEWTDKGAKILTNKAVSFAGTTGFLGATGGITCSETTATAVLEPGKKGVLTSFNAVNQTTKCVGSGGLSFCTVHSVTGTSFNWPIETNTTNIIISNLHIDTTTTGAFCPYHELTVRGTVTAVPNNPASVASVELFNSIELRNHTNNTLIGEVGIRGTWAMTPANTYGVK